MTIKDYKELQKVCKDISQKIEEMEDQKRMIRIAMRKIRKRSDSQTVFYKELKQEE